MNAMASQMAAARLFTQPFIHAHKKEYINDPRHWPVRKEFTGHWWIPLTKGQYRG